MQTATVQLMISFLDRGVNTTRTEAFVDGAFAFALTLLAIAGDHIPGSVGELIAALKGLPTNFTITSYTEVSVLFVTFGVAFGSLGLNLCLLDRKSLRPIQFQSLA